MNKLTKIQKAEILQEVFPVLLTDFRYAIHTEASKKREFELRGLKSDSEILIEKLYSKLAIKSTTCKSIGEKEVLYKFFNEFLKESRNH